MLGAETQEDPPSTFNVKVLDGATVVHFLFNTIITPLNDYACGVFVPHSMKHLETFKGLQLIRNGTSTATIEIVVLLGEGVLVPSHQFLVYKNQYIDMQFLPSCYKNTRR